MHIKQKSLILALKIFLNDAKTQVNLAKYLYM